MPKFLSSVLEVQEAVSALRHSPQTELFSVIESAGSIGSAIKTRRESIGATVEQVAELVGLLPNTLRQIEAGNGYCSFDWVLRVANVLGIDLFSGSRSLTNADF